MDVFDNPLDFRSRLIGTRIVAQVRRNVKRSLYIPPSSLYGPAVWTSATI
jgi:CRISPR/Cas system CSM-associated protein Csm3 (group 7 of RAMP superfamily)